MSSEKKIYAVSAIFDTADSIMSAAQKAGCHAQGHGVVEEHSKSVEARWRLTVEFLEERMQT